MRGRLASSAAVLMLGLACHVEPMVLAPCEDPSAPCWAVRRETPIADAQGDGVTRFFAVGDMGQPDATKLGLSAGAAHVASLVQAVCARRGGCDFGVMLGDNVYPKGIEGEPQARFFTELSRRYSNDWTLPLVYVLGNHDYDPYFVQTARARAELELIARLHDAHGGVIRGRAHFFDLSADHVDLFAWDTNYLVHACGAAVGGSPSCVDSGDAALRAIERSDAPFKVWLGHHPIRSNGEHGDAGELEECLAPWACVGIWSGMGFRQLALRHVVGKADLTLSGHDHALQVFSAPDLRGTALVVSGAGAKTTPLGREERRGAAWLAEAMLGFTLVEVTQDRLTVTVYGTPIAAGDVPLELPEGADPQPLFVMHKDRSGAWVRD
jgi:tartrate-resistant acid phosphatase type 5